MNSQNIESALIIAYRRHENVSRLIHILSKKGINRIYVAIDCNSPSDPASLLDVKKTIDVTMEASRRMPGQIRMAVHSENVGCSAAVLSACDWFFENEEFGVILEDDCIPAEEFFSYANHARNIIETNSNVWLFCGTQFASQEKSEDSWSLSRYALIWGWGTSKRNWNEIRSSLKEEFLRILSKEISFVEKQYWNAGASRSSSGVVDAWDNVLIHRMLTLGKKSILPKYALVSNVGNDLAATHTVGKSPWLRIETGSFDLPKTGPIDNSGLDQWLKAKVYRIYIRHILTTRITHFFDFISGHRNRAENLVIRWENARKNLTLSK